MPPHYPQRMMLNGRMMDVVESVWQADVDGLMRCSLRLRPEGDVTTAWWDEVVAGSVGPFGGLAAAGLTTSQAMQNLNATLTDLATTGAGFMSDAERDRFARRYADRKTTPAPDPVVRPTGRRFDFDDET
jgi:hypothetical protein